MVRIIDMTLSCLEQYDPSEEQIIRLISLLRNIETDIIELSVPIYRKLRNFIPDGRFMLRINMPDDVVLYPEFSRFVCRKSGFVTEPSVISEFQANDIREINYLRQYGNLENVRIVGFDDVMNHDYAMVFSNLKKQIHGRIELCPENKYHCATAIAVEWILSGGTDVVTTFDGIADKASLEEVIMALHLIKRFRPNLDLSSLSEMRSLIENIIASKIPCNKAVIGKSIFDVESGIHIDGIIKNPKNYEPFSPELVGNERKIVLGKHSGRKSIVLKLSELGIKIEGQNIDKLLTEVKTRSIMKATSISDEEFIELINKYKK